MQAKNLQKICARLDFLGPSLMERGDKKARRGSVPSGTPNQGLELTAYSVRLYLAPLPAAAQAWR